MFKVPNTFSLLLGLFLLLGWSPGRAEDIDIFAYRAASTSSGTASSNVLVIIDNGASFAANNSAFRCGISGSGMAATVYSETTGFSNAQWNAIKTEFDQTNAGVEQCALFKTLQNLATKLDANGVTLNLGIMVFNRSGQALKTFDVANNAMFSTAKCVSGAGGCLVLPMTPFTGTNRTNILNWIKSWAKTGNYDISGPASLGNGGVFQEAWAYLNARVGLSTVNYASAFPARPVSCGRDNIIYIGNNYGTQASPKDQSTAAGNPRNPLIGSAPSSGMNVDGASGSSSYANQLPSEQIPLRCTSSSALQSVTLDTSLGNGGYALNWAQYLYDNANALTVAVGVQGPSCDTQYAAHLEKLGSVGEGGVYTGSNYTELQTAIGSAFNKVLAVNSAYAAVSLPASTAAQGQFLNQVFIGLFRPASSFEPRWVGNLKQYKFKQVSGTLKLVDADERDAVNSATGFIDSCARSFWTPTAVDSYWGGGLGAGDCGTGLYSGDTAATSAQMQLSNTPDGQIVEKGGHAYWLRGGANWGSSTLPGSRTVYTCTPVPACTGRSTFNNGNSTDVTESRLGVVGATAATQRTDLINWIRGENNNSDVEAQALAAAPVRSSVHGDVIHSRPVAVNYAALDSDPPKVVVFYGANDGMLRAVNGAQSGSTTLGSTSFAAGAELWAFMPPEFYGSIKRLYDNTQTVAFPGSTATSVAPKSYGMDGPVTAYRGTVNGVANSRYIFATMRRGGRVIYAFDVTAPDNPILRWRKGCPTNFTLTLSATNKMSGSTAVDTNCTNDASGDFRDLGQTWSSLKPIKVASSTEPRLIMSGGYDPCEDIDNGTANHGCTSSAKGRKIYILNAYDGSIIKSFDTARSVVADTTIATDASGNAVYGYVADLGGDVYRICFVAGCAASASAGTSAPSDWTITRIASVGCDTPSTSAITAGGGYAWPSAVPCNAPRKFQFAPSVITENGADYYITLASGDREKPVAAYGASQAVKNVAVQIRDTPTGSLTGACSISGAAVTNVVCIGTTTAQQAGASLTRIDPTTVTAPSSIASRGWFLPLDANEQGVTGAITIFGTVTFSTNKPPSTSSSSTSCGPSLGETRVYNINYVNATPVKSNATSRWERVVGDGLPPSQASAGKVLLDPSNPASAVPFCIGCDYRSPLAGGSPVEASSITQPKIRLYRYLVR